MPTFPEASLRPPRSLRGRWSQRGLRPRRLCVQPASALLPPCVHPLPHRLLVLVPQLDADFALFEQVGAAVSAAARQARMVTWRPGATAAAQLRLRPPPSATSTWRAVRVAYLPPASMVAMVAPLSPSISLDLPRSQARDQRRATSTGVPPQCKGGGAALPRGRLRAARGSSCSEGRACGAGALWGGGAAAAAAAGRTRPRPRSRHGVAGTFRGRQAAAQPAPRRRSATPRVLA